jgi:hypothetical protein
LPRKKRTRAPQAVASATLWLSCLPTFCLFYLSSLVSYQLVAMQPVCLGAICGFAFGSGLRFGRRGDLSPPRSGSGLRPPAVFRLLVRDLRSHHQPLFTFNQLLRLRRTPLAPLCGHSLLRLPFPHRNTETPSAVSCSCPHRPTKKPQHQTTASRPLPPVPCPLPPPPHQARRNPGDYCSRLGIHFSEPASR